jgi:acetone carboxylase gamma subunit
MCKWLAGALTTARTAAGHVWNSDTVVWRRLGLANAIARDHQYHIVGGQTAVAICSCGEKILEWRGDWHHVHNPLVRGTDDHWARPQTGTVVSHRNWKELDDYY